MENIIIHKEKSERLIEILQNECSSYLNELKACEKGYLLTRSVRAEIIDWSLNDHSEILKNRRPTTMNEHVHALINDECELKFGWKIRNGAFCHGYDVVNGKLPSKGEYGTRYMFFPTDKEFKFVYEKNVVDLARNFDDMKGKFEALVESGKSLLDQEFERLVIDVKIKIGTLEIADKTLEYALLSGETGGLSHEISVRTESYYLVNMKYIEQIVKMIWED